MFLQETWEGPMTGVIAGCGVRDLGSGRGCTIRLQQRSAQSEVKLAVVSDAAAGCGGAMKR